MKMDMLLTMAIGLLLQTDISLAFTLSSNLEKVCQGSDFTLECGSYKGQQAYIKLLSVTVMTNSDSDVIVYETINNPGNRCTTAKQCSRTIHKSTDVGINDDYKHLYQYIASSCHGRQACNGSLPEYWDLVSEPKENCGKGTQYFAGAMIDILCNVDSSMQTVAAPPSTTPRTKPTTPTTTTPFPVVFAIYQPEMVGLEKVILGVATGLAIAILIMLLIVLYCCEKYRNHKRLGKLLRMLGAPKAQDDAFDELDYGKTEAWRDEVENLGALGEYTGVKPDEFLTLDKKAMESTGQIMYDTHNGTIHKGTTCSTIERLDHKARGKGIHVSNGDYTGSIDYDTEENLELEQRMAEAAALQYELDSGVHEEHLV